MTSTLDPRERRFVLPQRVLWQEGSVDNPDCLTQNDTGQSTLASVSACTLRGDGQATGLLLDFGRELHGGIQIVVGATNGNPIQVRIRFGESVSEAMGTPNNDHANHDITFDLRTWGTQEVGNTGFRFVRLDVLDNGAELRLLALRAVTLMRPLEYQGSFHCNDDRLNQIWQTGADTVHLCMQDYVWDGIKRDRLVWLGDMHPEMRVISTVFGAHPIVPQSLDYARDTTPLPGWMNGISSYSLWWVIIQRDWFQLFGNKDYLAEQHKYLTGLLRLLAEQVDANGRERLGEGRFLDWPSSTDPEATHAGLHALLVWALDSGSVLCQILEDTTTSAICYDALTRLRRYSPPLMPGSKQSAALLALAGLYPPADVNSQVLAQNPLSGISTFYGYYMLQARALAGDIDGGLELIRRYWGGMLDLGATSFWEHFDLDWMEHAGRIDELTPPGKVDVHATYGDHCYQGLRHSLCHGWAAGPTAWLSEHILGVQALSPGFATVRIKPQLGDLTEAEGVVPTPFGPLAIRCRRAKDGRIQTDFDVPDGIQVQSE